MTPGGPCSAQDDTIPWLDRLNETSTHPDAAAIAVVDRRCAQASGSFGVLLCINRAQYILIDTQFYLTLDACERLCPVVA
jgi:hypothetical protein